ncbi:hypothetical protein EW145_g1442 [Phellinidium pouzarii]|uniref:DUF4246 domain-containing protein n=1 Tax=Phellinidium pouzarii TaxID=167371 RepID=A0A4S4LF43_9AGAM|nr:hypothetical protein EW145_g1442 [Phellinidium pouzarii]
MTTLPNGLSPTAGYHNPFVDGTAYLFGVGERPRTLCELAMTRLSAELRSKRGWWLVFDDPATRQRWYEEAANKTWRVGPMPNNIEVGLAKHQIEYVLDELVGYAIFREEANEAQVSCFDRIWETDRLLNNVEDEMLQECLDSLHVLIRSSTFASNSDVLIDPLRYSCIFGRTFLRNQTDCPNDHNDYCTSLKFTALPAVVRIHADNSCVEYQSTINGVDPCRSEIYEALQRTLGRCINLFEKVLTSLHRSNPLPQRIRGSYRYRVWEEPDPPEESDDEEAWEQHLRDVRQWALYRPIEIPDIPPEGYRNEFLRLGHKVHLRDRHIQVIHRIVDAYLDDGRQMIADTPWHIAGMKNEHIVASALHFVSVQGIYDGRLDFRMAVTSPSNFMPHDVGATLRTWGLQSGDPCNQFIGSVPLRTGLTIAFPNIYQHRMRDIQLGEGCSNGRLAIVEFYLVDPDVPPIISTADVAPQQRDLIYRALANSIDPRLPPEVLEKIVDMVESVLFEEEAVRYHEEMLKERQNFMRVNDEKYFSLPFDMDAIDQIQELAL